MNAFKKLQLEYDGIFGMINNYTNDANVLNYLHKLKSGISDGDYDVIIYSLEGIADWYREEMHDIIQDTYNPQSHINNHNFIHQTLKTLKPEDCVSTEAQRTLPMPKSQKLIFLSHKSKDKKYADALRDFIIGLGVQNNQLIYTSHPLHKIPMDANIYDYLRNNISSEIFMIILWSNDYLESPACLNEMGAAWVTQSDYTNIYVPTFSFGNPKYHECAVDTRKMGAVLNGDAHCRANLIELKNKILTMFSLKDDEQNSAYLIDQFIEKITEVQNG